MLLRWLIFLKMCESEKGKHRKVVSCTTGSFSDAWCKWSNRFLRTFWSVLTVNICCPKCAVIWQNQPKKKTIKSIYLYRRELCFSTVLNCFYVPGYDLGATINWTLTAFLSRTKAMQWREWNSVQAKNLKTSDAKSVFILYIIFYGKVTFSCCTYI